MIKATILFTLRILYISVWGDFFLLFKYFVGLRYILCGHWFPLFRISGDTAHEFQGQGGSMYIDALFSRLHIVFLSATSASCWDRALNPGSWSVRHVTISLQQSGLASFTSTTYENLHDCQQIPVRPARPGHLSFVLLRHMPKQPIPMQDSIVTARMCGKVMFSYCHSVCLSVCLSIRAITFECLDIET